MLSAMGNEVSAGEGGDPEENGEGEDWTSKEETEASGGLWSLSHHLDDGKEVCVFTCSATSISQTQLCQSGAEHLLLLRHPNVLKFLTYDLSKSPIVLVTEPVLPVKSVMSAMCMEGMVTGWRGVAQGLIFLHDKARMSHNSLCCECVYVCVNTSQWKIGGFEAAAQHSKMNKAFIELIATIRPPSTVPPEDKTLSDESCLAVPCHSRDVWAFSHLVLSTVEEANLNSQISDPMYTYIQQHMLNPDPTLRPTVGEILAQHWMRNDASEIAEFLSHLTVKSQAVKDEFFASLTPRLHSLPPSVVAEHLVPLLLTPLVMTEHVAHKTLWPHLLTPASSSHPQRMSFDPTHICPILDEDLFIHHAVPLLLNLMETHDYHVRRVLLEHLLHFAPLCPKEELIGSLLPEVLVGLHDVRDEMVQATLRSLADLVGLLGGETVMGTARSNIFADATPRSQGVAELTTNVPPSSLPTHVPPPLSTPSQDEMRRQRAERMREKREMQRQKKMAASSKLGVAGIEVNEEVECEDLATPPHHPQYSPSVSHDEEERGLREIVEEEVEEEGEGEGEGDGEGESSEEPWEEFVEDEVKEYSEWGESWGGGEGEDVESRRHESEGTRTPAELEVGWSLAGSRTEGKEQEKMAPTPPSRTGGMKLTSSLKLGSGRARTAERGVSSRDKNEDRERSAGTATRAKLSEEDRLRLEEQAAWSKEPDFFADMVPTVAKKSPLLHNASKVSMETKMTKSALQYQPPETEAGDAWGGWNDF